MLHVTYRVKISGNYTFPWQLYFRAHFHFFPLHISASHRSERSELSIGEEIEEDLSMGVDDVNTSDKVRC